MKFRKRPVVVEAEQFTDEAPNPFGVVQFGCSCEDNECPFYRHHWVTTLEGRLQANYGDWIVKGIKGEYYPVRDDIFQATYEKVNGST